MIKKIKTRLTRIIFTATAVLSLFCSTSIPVNAAGVTVSSGSYTGYSVTSTNANGRWVTNANVQQILIDGEIGFCTEPGILLNEGSGFNPNSYDAENLSIIAYEGWVRSGHTMEDYLATQFMIWESVGGTITSTSFSAYGSYKGNIQNKIAHHNDQPSFNLLNITLNVDESVTLTDSNGVFEQYTLSSNGGLSFSKSGNTLTINGTLDAPENAKVIFQKVPDNCIGTSILYSKSGSQSVAKLYVKDPLKMNINVKVQKYGTLSITKKNDLGINVVNTSFNVSTNADMSNPVGTYTTGADGTVLANELLPGTYYVQETGVPADLVLDSTIHSIVIKPNETSYFTATNKIKRGYIQVVKKDKDSGKTVAKANTTFSVYKYDGTFVQDITTNNKGIATTPALLYGDYYLLEKLAPDGYVGTTDKLIYSITEDGKTYAQSISNKRVSGSLSIKKQDSVTGNTPQGEATLKGAVYELKARTAILDPADSSVKYAKDAVVATLTTDANANASISNLYLGKYYLKEKKPSEGYTLDTSEYEVPLTYENQTVEVVTKSLTVKEKVISQAFELIKVSDNGSGEADLLAGVEFTIKAQKDIDAAGSWEKAPIAKNAQGKSAAILVTDKKGYAKSEELPVGSYVVRETKAPADHYAIPDFKVEIKEDSREPQTWRVFNDVKFRAVVSIVKKDAVSDKLITLSGAKFKIKNLDKDEYVGHWVWNPLPHYVDSWTTDTNGAVMTDDVLDPGNYQLEEVEAPDSYLLSEPIEFKIAMNGAFETLPDGTTPVITIVMKDEKPIGEVELVKTDKDDKEPLSGVQYQLTAAKDVLDPADGTVIYKAGEPVSKDISEDGYYMTDENGMIHVTDLPLGSYTWKETKALDGYVKDEKDHTFTLSQENDTQKIYTHKEELVNQKTKIELLKVDMDGTALTGAKLHLSDSKGTIIKEWISKDSSIMLKGLLVKETYTLYEDEAPQGYVQSKPVTFTVKNTEEIQEFKMIDRQVTALKVDEDGKNLSGAKMQVINTKTKNIVDKWTTDGKEHAISGLIEDGNYILQEIEAPEGLEKAEDIRFHVNTDKKKQTLKMKDMYIVKEIQLLKIDKDTKKPITSSEFTFTIYRDEECKEKLLAVSSEPDIGMIKASLRYGDWWIKETKAPQGYQLSQEVLHLKIGTAGVYLNGHKIGNVDQNIRFSFENSKLPTVKTGDSNFRIYPMLMLMATSGLLWLCLRYQKRKQNKE